MLLTAKLIQALPIPGSAIVRAEQFGESLFGNTAKLTVKLPDGALQEYFLKANLAFLTRINLHDISSRPPCWQWLTLFG